MGRILENIRVLDMTQYQAGPVCTTWLGDLGAEVIKVEPPWGDPMRFAWVAKGLSIYFIAVNRNKKSISLNLRDERGLKIFKDLVKQSDVVVENFAPGTMERLGIGYETLREINPKIVFASISGFGQYGPYHKRLSFDIIAQAVSGYMTITAQSVTATTGRTDIPPVLVTDAIGDTFPGTL
ncbi:MAG: CaiB/BaiF CoA transferase family protein, partial [Candidatus Bathyarchaeia archaeon]